MLRWPSIKRIHSNWGHKLVREGNVSDILDKFQFLKTKRSISLRYSGFSMFFPFFWWACFHQSGIPHPFYLKPWKTSNIWQCNKGPFDTPGLGSRVLGSADGGRNGHCEDTNLQLSIVVCLQRLREYFQIIVLYIRPNSHTFQTSSRLAAA